ncbi:hypothetical protein IFM5058_10798 [Aspergillus udagawae]|nr:hypothetical protein IFM5058_10798 [Aspergillus udagawae]
MMPAEFYREAIASTPSPVEQHGPAEETSSNLSDSSTPTNQPRELKGAELQQILQRITELERLQQIRKVDDSERLYYRNGTSSSTEDKQEIKFKNLPIFTIKYSLQKREEWLRDMEYVFRGAPKKYGPDKFKIIAAISQMDSTCRQRWYIKINEMSAEKQREAEDSWPFFKNWTLSLIQDAETVEADVIVKLRRAHQRPDEDPREFHCYLDSLEQHFPRQEEKQRALAFFGSLTPELRTYIQEHLDKLPDTRDEMVSVALKYHTFLQKRQKRKREDIGRPREGKPQDGNPSKRFRSNPERFTKPKRNRLDKDGNPLKCYKCGSEEHLANRCIARDAKVQSITENDEGSE